jgi:O-antigen/teichoic acid export membrane protein
MRLGRTAFLHFLSQVAVSVSGFAATFAIARLGGADVLGVYATAVALTFWLNIPSTAIGDALTKRLSEPGDSRGAVATALLLNAGIAAVLLAALLLARPLVDDYVGASVGGLVAALVVSNVGLVTVVSVLNGEKRVELSGGIKALERLVRSGIHVGAIVAGLGVAALVAGHVVATLLAVVVGALLSAAALGRPSRERGRSLVSYARYAWLGTLKTRAFGWMDTIVLAAFVSPTLVGVYEVSWNLASLFALVAVSVQSTLFPEMSELDGIEESYDRVHHYLNEGLVFAGVFLVPGLFGAVVLGERVLRIYGGEFSQGAGVLALLVVARLLAVYGEQFLNAVNAVDRPEIAFRVNLAFVGLNLVLNVSLVWAFGWLGAAVATLVSAGVTAVLSYWGLVAVMGVPDLPVGEFARQVVASSVMAGAVLLLRRVVPGSQYATVGLAFVGVAVYVVCLLGVSPRVREKFENLTRSAMG